MKIQISETPNPLARKYIITEIDTPFGDWDGQVNFQNVDKPYGENRSKNDATRESPFADWLFNNLEDFGVFSVAFSPRVDAGEVVEAHITVGRKNVPGIDWPELDEVIKDAILAHAGEFLNKNFQKPETQIAYHARVLDFFKQQHGQQAVDKVEPVLVAIQALTPYVKGDGGNLKFKSINFETGEVFVEMTGACTGCSKIGDTLSNVQDAIRENFGLNITMVNIANTEQPAAKFDDFVIA